MLNKKSHILFLCSWYPSRVFTTNGDFIQRHAEAVANHQQISVLHIVSDKNLKTDFEINFQNANNVATYIGYVRFTRNPFFKALLFYKVFKHILKRIGEVDLVHLNVLYPFGIFALYLKYIKKKVYVITEHWTIYTYPLSKNLSFIQKILSKWIVKEAAFVCPVSRDLKESMEKLGLKGNYKIIPNVVDTSVFVPNKKRGNLQKNILHISSLKNEHKNIVGIIEGLKKLEKEEVNFHMNFIGGSMELNNYYANTYSLDKDFYSFYTHLSHEILVQFFQKSDVLVLFSNYENLPCVILEAFSCGVPVISTNVGGISEFFPANFGILIPENDCNKLSEALLQILSGAKNIAAANTMHQYVVDNFSKEQISKQISEIYCQC